MKAIEITKELYAANSWSTKTVLEAVTDELADAPTGGSFPTAKATLIHIWDAQSVWYNRLTDRANAELPSKFYDGSLQALKDGLLLSCDNLEKLLEDKDDDYLDAKLKYTNLQGKEFEQPIYQILFHLTQHSAMHRGQVILQLRQAGFTGKLPQTDAIAWFRLFR